jgi:hypothetical protein
MSLPFVSESDSTPVIFKPPFVGIPRTTSLGASPRFNPMMQITSYDEKENIIVRKKWYTPESTKL